MQWRGDEAYGYRESVHHLKDADEVPPLVWQKFVERFPSSLGRIGNNHFLNGELPLNTLLGKFKIFKEHVLGSNQANPFGAHFECFLCIVRGIGIRAYVKFSDRVR